MIANTFKALRYRKKHVFYYIAKTFLLILGTPLVAIFTFILWGVKWVIEKLREFWEYVMETKTGVAYWLLFTLAVVTFPLQLALFIIYLVIGAIWYIGLAIACALEWNKVQVELGLADDDEREELPLEQLALDAAQTEKQAEQLEADLAAEKAAREAKTREMKAERAQRAREQKAAQRAAKAAKASAKKQK